VHEQVSDGATEISTKTFNKERVFREMIRQGDSVIATADP